MYPDASDLEHIKVVKAAVEKRAKTDANILATIEDELEMEDELSMRILRPFLIPMLRDWFRMETFPKRDKSKAFTLLC